MLTPASLEIQKSIRFLLVITHDFQAVRDVLAVGHLRLKVASPLHDVTADILNFEERLDFPLELFDSFIRHLGAVFNQRIRGALNFGGASIEFKLKDKVFNDNKNHDC